MLDKATGGGHSAHTMLSTRCVRLVGTVVTAVLVVGGCDSGNEGPTTLRQLIVSDSRASGVSLTDPEIDCLDRHLSDRFGLEYPASLADYRTALRARAATIISQYPSGDFPIDPTWQAMSEACLTASQQDEFFAASLTNTKLSALTAPQRSCLLAAVEPLHGTVPPDGIQPDALRLGCGIPDEQARIVEQLGSLDS